MGRKIGGNNPGNSGAGSTLPEGNYACIFQGEQDLPDGAAVAVYRVMINDDKGALKDAGFSVDLFLTEQDNPNTYKQKVVKEIMTSCGLDDEINEGDAFEFPPFGTAMPQELTVPVEIYLKRNKKGYLAPWAVNYTYVRPWTPKATGNGKKQPWSKD